MALGGAYLCLLQHRGVVHAQLAWNRLHEPLPAHWHDSKPTPQHSELLDGTSKVIPGGGRGRGQVKALFQLGPLNSLTSCRVFPLVARTRLCSSSNIISPVAMDTQLCTSGCKDPLSTHLHFCLWLLGKSQQFEHQAESKRASEVIDRHFLVDIVASYLIVEVSHP